MSSGSGRTCSLAAAGLVGGGGRHRFVSRAGRAHRAAPAVRPERAPSPAPRARRRRERARVPLRAAASPSRSRRADHPNSRRSPREQRAVTMATKVQRIMTQPIVRSEPRRRAPTISNPSRPHPPRPRLAPPADRAPPVRPARLFFSRQSPDPDPPPDARRTSSSGSFRPRRGSRSGCTRTPTSSWRAASSCVSRAALDRLRGVPAPPSPRPSLVRVTRRRFRRRRSAAHAPPPLRSPLVRSGFRRVHEPRARRVRGGEQEERHAEIRGARASQGG